MQKVNKISYIDNFVDSLIKSINLISKANSVLSFVSSNSKKSIIFTLREIPEIDLLNEIYQEFEDDLLKKHKVLGWNENHKNIDL